MRDDSSTYGYARAGVKAGDGYVLVPVGAIAEAGDEYYEVDLIGADWVLLTMASPIVGSKIESHWGPVRRRLNAVPTRWSCGHGRDPGYACCPVCMVFYRSVTS